MPKRILHVVAAMNRGGVETWLMHILRKTDSQSYAMDFLVHTAEPAQYDREILSLGSRIIACPYSRSPLKYFNRLRHVNRRYGPYDVVHSHVFTFSGFVLPLARALGVETRIAHSHTGGMGPGPNAWLRAYSVLMRTLIRVNASHKIGISEIACKSLFGERWQERPDTRVLLYGFDFSDYWELPSREAAKAEIGVGPAEYVIGNIGRFVELKNHRLLLQIVQWMRNQGQQVHLVLVGDGPLFSEMRGAAKSMGLTDAVTFAGTREDVARFFAAMDLFVLPSRYEGLGIVALEAQAAGVPVLASEAVPPEVDVVPGFVERLDVQAGVETWSTRALEMLMNPPVSERPTAELLGASRFSIDRCMRNLCRIYDGDDTRDIDKGS